MLQYKWRSGLSIDDNNLAIEHENETSDIVPSPMQQVIQPTGLNLFALNNSEYQGANENENNNDEHQNVQEMDE